MPEINLGHLVLTGANRHLIFEACRASSMGCDVGVRWSSSVAKIFDTPGPFRVGHQVVRLLGGLSSGSGTGVGTGADIEDRGGGFVTTL
jgi:hypothetical protein